MCYIAECDLGTSRLGKQPPLRELKGPRGPSTPRSAPLRPPSQEPSADWGLPTAAPIKSCPLFSTRHHPL